MKLNLKGNLKPDPKMIGGLLDQNLPNSSAPRVLPGSGPLSRDVLKVWQDKMASESTLN